MSSIIKLYLQPIFFCFLPKDNSIAIIIFFLLLFNLNEFLFQINLMKSKRTLDEPYKNSPKRARNALINNGEQEVSSQFDASMSYDDSIFDRDDPEIHLDENFDTENISNNADYGQNGMDYSVSQDQIYSNDEATNIGSKNSNYQASLKIIEERNHNSSCNLGEIGHIKSITLQNFMCHANFHLDFGPRVNFIVGQNGSE